jgi:hypothetical protein
MGLETTGGSGASALPTQVCTWTLRESGFDWTGGEGASEPEWLYCLKGTVAGDRQVIWSGVEGSGLLAVVDFSGDRRERAGKRGRYEGWGRVTELRRAIPVEVVLAHPILGRRFAKPIQSVYRLDRECAHAIVELSGGLPPEACFGECPAEWKERGGDWGRHSLPPEAIVEELVRDRSRLARKLGFSTKVATQVILANGKRPDLWCDAGVVGDAKNRVTATWGPEQIEGYISQCDTQWPKAAPWRGVLVQGEPEMAPNARARLEASAYRDRIEVWSVFKGRFGRATSRRLF